jgi:hypothetical protein
MTNKDADDKRHAEVHDYLRKNALAQIESLNNKQFARIKCGWCNKTLELSIPSLNLDLQ